MTNPKIISLFNHKGGVGKTTVAHNLAVSLTKEGKNVLLIDADPQMNLTAAVMGLADSVEYADSNMSKWQEARNKYTNISDYLNSWLNKRMLHNPDFQVKLFEYSPEAQEPLIETRGKLSLLSGDIQLFNLESRIYSIVTTTVNRNDGTIYAIEESIRELGKEYDYILIDTSPSASSILNGVLIMMSDYFLAPVFPNFFSLQAVDNLYDVLQNWIDLLIYFRVTANNKGLSFQPKFLGIIINMAKRFSDEDGKNQITAYADNWKSKLNDSINRFYRQVLDSKRTVTETDFINIFPTRDPFVIEQLFDFTGQIRSVAEIAGVPVIDLTNQKVKNAIEKNNSQKGNHRISLFYVTKPKDNSKEDHYMKAFKALSESYTFVAKSIAENLK